MSPHRNVLTGMVLQHGWTRGAELGVDKGILFGQLLRECPDLHLIGVDVFPLPDRHAKVVGIAQAHADRAVLMPMRTHQASRLLPNRSLDFVFIDADHSDPSVTEDIQDWQPKVRSGGLLCGHDYNRKFPGVMTAVDRAFGRKVQTWPGSIWGVWQ